MLDLLHARAQAQYIVTLLGSRKIDPPRKTSSSGSAASTPHLARYQVHSRRRDGQVLIPAVARGKVQSTQAREQLYGANEHRDVLERRNLEAA